MPIGMRSQSRICGIHHGSGQLMRSPRSWTIWYESDEPVRDPQSLGLVKGGAGKAKRRRRLGDRLPPEMHPPQHFIFDLNQVAGIKKLWMLQKQRIVHLVRARIPRVRVS